MSPLSLHYRLSKRLVTGISALLVVFVAVLGTLLVSDHSREFDRSLESKARALLDLAQRQGAVPAFTDSELLAIEDGESATFFAIRSGGDVDPVPRFANITLPGGSTGRQVEITFRPRAWQLDGLAGSDVATVVVAAPRVPLLWKAAKASLTLLGFGVLLLVALSLLVRNALRRGLEPVVGLRRQMETLDSTHRGQRVNLQAPPEELAPILRHINELLERTEVPVPSEHSAAR